jgi:Type IV secretion system pilin
MHIPWLSSRYKFILLVLAWTVWLVINGTSSVFAVADQENVHDKITSAGSVMLAQAVGGTPGTSTQQTNPTGGTPTVTNTNTGGSNSAVRLSNPLSGINSIPDLLAAILNVVIIIAIPIIILFIMLAGFKYVTARGNAAQVKEASTALLYAVIGGVIIIGATAIAQIIKNLVNAFAAT